MSQQICTVPIRGMHCRSCELLIEDALSEISEVQRCEVSFKKQKAIIHYDGHKPTMHRIEEAVRAAGYTVGEPDKRPLLSKSRSDYADLGIAFLLLLAAYFILKQTGLSNVALPSGSNPSSLPVIVLIGITAGFSTCMALVGGLVLGISARHAEMHPEATARQKFRPHLFFNLGRIISYAVLGGLLGLLGATFQLSNLTLGILTLVVGGVMLLLGTKLIGIFPRLENISFTLPAGISKFLGMKRHEKEYSHRGSAMLGALTFFLPCGFTQAMQLYAMSSGSFSQGALIMAAFAIGTAPGLLGVGGVSSIVKGIFAQRFFKFAGLVVIVFALFNISNGVTLTGLNIGSDSLSANAAAADPNVEFSDGVQIVRMKETAGGYSPKSFTIQKDVPVRWVIEAEDPYSCASSLTSSALNIRTRLTQGENIIEFTPKATGKIGFSCSMGMYRGSFTVVEKSQVGPVAGDTTETGELLYSPANTAANEQRIATEYTYYNDIQPNEFTVSVNVPVRFEVNAKEDGTGCMSTIMIPGLYNTPELLEKGETIVMQFTPKKKGVYEITCAMGVPRGTITVQ